MTSRAHRVFNGVPPPQSVLRVEDDSVGLGARRKLNHGGRAGAYPEHAERLALGETLTQASTILSNMSGPARLLRQAP